MSDPVVTAVERANQRGGRMLSLVDLLEAGTLSLPQASWLLARVWEGSSRLVGATPGGAGKTAVMCALLAMIPPGERVLLTNPGSGWRQAGPGDTLVAYELSPGSYDAYIWGEEVGRLAELGRGGCRIVANLHADTLRQAREQVAGECGGLPAGRPAFEARCAALLAGYLRQEVRTVEALRARWLAETHGQAQGQAAEAPP
jgi:hypothetical protein